MAMALATPKMTGTVHARGDTLGGEGEDNQ
jgi:hypothetical protein